MSSTSSLRGDTPQHYEDIHYRNIQVDAPSGPLITIQPWTQYFDLKGQQPPKSMVKNITFTNVRGKGAVFGTIRPNPGQTTISDIVLKDWDIQLAQPQLAVSGVEGLQFENVVINGKPVATPQGGA